MKIRGGLKGLTQQPAATARWFLVAPELSRLAGTQAEHMVGVQRTSSSHHHDLSEAVTSRYNENVQSLRSSLLVVILSRPDLDIKETISTFALAEYPMALFFSDGSLRHCATKSKLMNILESLLPAQQQPQTSTVQPHSADPSSRQVVIIDVMAVVQAMGKPPWVRNGRDLASDLHFQV